MADREGQGGGSGGTGRRNGRDGEAEREGRGVLPKRRGSVISDLAVIYCRSIGG